MTDSPQKQKAKVEIGYSGQNTRYGQIRADEFQQELKGKRGLKKYREMRDNDATIGAVMYATEQVLRDVPRKIIPADESEEAKAKAEWLETVFEDMEHTLDDHISEALSSLTFGFSIFEVVYKIRGGPDFKDKKRYSKYDDGNYGIRKIASRAQWTIDRFDVDETTGDIKGIWQENSYNGIGENYIPKSKIMHYRTTTVNNDPSGRSILRNAYKSYTFLTNLQTIEAIAAERELHGLPIVRLPSDYLAEDATDDQKAIRELAERVARDVKFNEQGSIVFPSDTYPDEDGKPSTVRMVDIELIASQGTRNIDIDPIVRRYQHDIARSVMAEFMMLGSSSTGSYALSKSKTDLFLRSMESYINAIYDVINMQLVKPLWELNGFDIKTMPKVIAGDVAPHELKELGAYVRNLNGAQIDITNQIPIINALLEAADLPELDEAKYEESRQEKKEMAEKKMQQSPTKEKSE